MAGKASPFPSALHADEFLWLNLVERWFAEITRQRIRRGVFRSVRDLTEAIESYLAINNANPKPFRWTKSVNEILEKVGRDASVTQH